MSENEGVIQIVGPAPNQVGTCVEKVQEGATVEEALKGKKHKRSTGGFGAIVMSKNPKELGGQEPQRRLSQREEEMLKGIEEKASRAGLDVNIRILTSAETLPTAQATLNNILNSFAQYNIYHMLRHGKSS